MIQDVSGAGALGFTQNGMGRGGRGFRIERVSHIGGFMLSKAKPINISKETKK